MDLRSDTVTLPTPEMRRAMAEAEVGDDVYGEDPTVNRLQSLAAALLGKESALFVPSGTMANQLALRVLGTPGSELLCADGAHVYRYEGAAAAMNSGMQCRLINDDDGLFTADDVRDAVEVAGYHRPPASVLWIENSHMPANGRLWTSDEVAAAAGAAHAAGLRVHCDGARIWNASVALGVPPSELAAACDTVMFCLSKGLGAPIGSLLCGTADVIAEARLHRQRLGGAMRQAGVVAAAGVVAVETMVDRLADDHARALVLAEALAARWPGSVEPVDVRTNIVCTSAAALPESFPDEMLAAGILFGPIDPRTYRFVTHKDIDDDDLARTLSALDAVHERR
ncbi:MAG: aminotransferase class I/II-fold pyridoxal phosphate-dependent enzyme [Acidimicrobiia bacterium]|nr:aminotransferase class I/II-fold pyridoxal phosphate-dependent enzyme [Acidimicrobiia bacterium]